MIGVNFRYSKAGCGEVVVIVLFLIGDVSVNFIDYFLRPFVVVLLIYLSVASLSLAWAALAVVARISIVIGIISVIIVIGIVSFIVIAIICLVQHQCDIL